FGDGGADPDELFVLGTALHPHPLHVRTELLRAIDDRTRIEVRGARVVGRATEGPALQVLEHAGGCLPRRAVLRIAPRKIPGLLSPTTSDQEQRCDPRG